MNLSSAEGTALLREVFHAFLEIRSSVFAVFCILLGAWFGAWLSRRSELMRLRVQRRTQIFDEACRVTAECSLMFGVVIPTTGIPPPHPLEISVTSLDRKIETTFSRSAYTAWRAAYNSSPPLKKDAFDKATRVALDAIAKEIK
jgi:hypothetical protein